MNDGSIPYGSRVLTINSVTYVADNLVITRPRKMIERTNQVDVPSGQVSVPGFVSGTATLQLSTDGAVPLADDTFTDTFVASIGAEVFFLTDVGQPENKDAERKVDITFRKAITRIRVQGEIE